ncbi:MAG: hypothetical protein QM652_00175 [Legionella sp.]|uniref:protein YgfX n=1 Tax=Legionella sp. TaxID=459 RepID=UPI0039E6857A
MLHLSEITIKPGDSRLYWRLVLVLYLLTIFLVIFSSLFWIIKLVLVGIIAVLLRVDWTDRRPNNGIKEIQFINGKWLLYLNNGKKLLYKEVQVLIHNPLFQLIQFSHEQHKRLIVLFHDQIPKEQWRLLHLKIRCNIK